MTHIIGDHVILALGEFKVMLLTREQAFSLLNQYVTAEHLLKHSIAVEIAMRAYAKHFQQNVEYWGQVGLLHDIDYQLYPTEHLHHTQALLEPAGFSHQFITDIISHNRNWPEPRTLIQKTLLSVDEITGFVIACVLVRPDKNIANLEVKSVLKKFKDKAFAKAVNRETIKQSVAELDVPLEEHIQFIIDAFKEDVAVNNYKSINLFA